MSDKIKVKSRYKAIVFIAVPLFFFFSCEKKAPYGGEAGYGSIMVEFESHNQNSRATEYETLWIDQKNKREASLFKRETIKDGTLMITETLVFTNDDWRYNIDLLSKTGTKMSVKEINKMAHAFGEVAKISEAGLPKFIEENGGKMMGSEMFLDKKCVVFELFGLTQCMYKGIVLKTMAGSVVVKKATKIEEDVEVPDSLFTVPEGIVITEAASISGMSYK